MSAVSIRHVLNGPAMQTIENKTKKYKNQFHHLRHEYRDTRKHKLIFVDIGITSTRTPSHYRTPSPPVPVYSVSFTHSFF